MDLNRQIKSAEKKYKQILEGFFASVYKDDYLPSHGLSHHRRVWNIAKEIAEVLNNHNLLSDNAMPGSLIIACYLHDSGMAADHGPDHGKHSARLTEEFLEKNKLPAKDYPGLCEAVLLHDKKEYASPSLINLHSVLSMADDLDAFGIIGVYRYLEIYLLRGVTLPELGKKIRQNAATRFRHFEELMNFDEKFVRKHRKRYETLDTFFQNLDNDLINHNASAYLTIVDIINSMVQTGSLPEQIIARHENDEDPCVSLFFKSFGSELCPQERTC